ncbi:MAG: gliding motility-associated C-terminal domain-containing protein [Bacteroidales bacterium]|nr:gliding motility-associated C-terminal domain-containing protein [Bacteroidales bacterium]
MKKYILLVFYLLLLIPGINKKVFSQTHTVTHNVDWVTQNQNMWGPDGDPFSIDMDITLFDISFDEDLTFGEIFDTWLGDFGAEFNLDMWLEASSVFGIHGFTSGSVDAKYPVTIDLTFPDNYTFNPGQWITINTEYAVRPGWDLTTHFPTTGIIQLDLFFGFGVDLSATVCIFSCVTFTIIDIEVPTDSINIFYLNSITGEVAYPCWDGFFFTICHDDLLPIIIEDWWNIGLTGWIDIPYVETHDWLGADKCIYASGNDLWLHLNLDIIDFLCAIFPAIQPYVGWLSGTLDIGGGISIDYTLLALNFGINEHMVQDFTLCPTVWTRFTFPTSVPWTITDPGNGDALVNSGNSAVIDIQVDYDLNFKYPCDGYPILDMGIQHNLTNDFTNHTWDSMAFYFNITAFEFWINLPSFPILPDICIPENCILIPTPCPEKSNPDTCWQTVCTPEICTPAVVLPPTDPTIHIGPLINITLPLGYIPITWFDETWQLGGWTPNQTGIYDTIMPDEQIIPNPPMTMDAMITNDIICYGDTNGVITAFVENGTPPYTYIWSTGDSTTTNNTSNSISNLAAGWYYVTVYDSGPCYFYDSVFITNIDPPLYIWLEPKHVTCFGGSDGKITAHVTGGTPGYVYTWYPFGGSDSVANNLPAGTYSVVVTDLYNCDISDTTTLIELWPLPEINIEADPLEGCEPLIVQFYETTADSGQTYLWNFGDGDTSTLKYPVHIYEDEGIYDVTIYVTSNHGCLDSVTNYDWITVYHKPHADFMPVYSGNDILDSWIFLDNLSDNTYWSYWALGDGEYSNETDPLHHYVDTGYFHVVLYIATEHDCRDTAERDLYIRESITFYAPNAFTPDNNGENEVFLVKGTGILENTFNMLIFDRWGKKVFESDDIEKGWDGKVNGKLLRESGVYTWVVTYKDITKRKHKQSGSVLLLR